LRNLAKDGANAFKIEWGISSPSTVFEGFGMDLMDGLIFGIQSKMPALMATMNQVASTVGSITGLANQITGKNSMAGALAGTQVISKSVSFSTSKAITQNYAPTYQGKTGSNLMDQDRNNYNRWLFTSKAGVG
jgi:hypothetical protein